jgi:DNA-binding NarL/FixJ family response regulator
MPKLRGLDELRGRLKQVANLLLDGLSNAEIGNELGIKTRMVKAYIRRLKLHYDAPNRIHLAIILLKSEKPDRGPMMPELTSKQLTVANLVADGLNNREIAAKTGCTYNSTRNVIKDLFDRCGVWSRLELTLFILHHRGSQQINSELQRSEL